MHIIFGSRNPAQRAPKLRKKGDLWYSASNYNLFIDSSPLELSLGKFLNVLNFGRIWEPMLAEGYFEPVRLLEDDLRSCTQCQKATGVACPLFQNPSAEIAPDSTLRDVVKAVLWPRSSPAQVDLCRLFERLSRMTETPAEARFLELYFQYCLRYARPGEVLQEAYSGEMFSRFREWGHPVEPGDFTWMFDVHVRLLALLTEPALIPQVMLNFVGAEQLPNDHPDKNFYETNVGRVDFMFFNDRGTHVVEIDGPYHHRTEDEYTRLLRQDRTLRYEGYHVHRFSNLEIMRAKDFSPFARELFR